MTDFEDELKARFEQEAETIDAPPASPLATAQRAHRRRIQRNVARGSAALALTVALGVVIGSLGSDRTPTVQIVQPIDGTTAEPSDGLPPETSEPSPSHEPTTGKSEPDPTPKPKYVPPPIGGEGQGYSAYATKEALVEEDTNDHYDIYRQGGPGGPVLVSVSDSEEIANGGSETSNRAISRDGRYVVFWSGATNLTDEDRGGLFVRDLLTGTTKLVRPIYNGSEVGSPATPSIETALSGDGRHIAFAGSAPETLYSIFVHHLDEEVTELGWETPAGAKYVDFNREFTLSYTGRFLAVTSTRADITENECGTPDCGPQAYLRDLSDGSTELLSVAPDGRQGNASSIYVYLSDDDRLAYFQSCATNLIDANAAPPSSPECNNAQARWFVRDRNTNTTTLSD